MITIEGREYGTAKAIAALLGVKEATLRRWADRDGLQILRAGRTVLFPLLDAALIEAAKRGSTRGRPRKVIDTHTLATS